MDEARPCFIAGVHKQSKGKEPLLSAMQVEHGLKRGESTFMAALLEIKPGHAVEIPEEIAPVLAKFKT